MNYIRFLRIFIALLIFVQSAFFLGGYVPTGRSSATSAAVQQSQIPFQDRHPIVEPRNNVTVISGQGFGDRPGSALIAFNPDGRLLYYNNTYQQYFDIDPVPGTRRSVLYVASSTIDKATCGASVNCIENVVERVNLTTGETTRLYSHTGPEPVDKSTHDVDRVSETEIIIADIAYDRVYIVNTSTGLITWEWEAQQALPIEGGGSFPADWTHMNDVDVLPNGQVMVSLRNQDQVVFINRQTGILKNLTLGAEDEYSILYEQHNPDYLPRNQGGPAILVSDSHNNRLVEYQRHSGEWVQSWKWRDPRLQWPRDVDRLPNGHTLIVDTNGNRVLEINREGQIVWSTEIFSAYDAERLGTGDGSTNGPSAVKADLKSKYETSVGGGIKQRIKSTLPPKLVNSLQFIFPGWASISDILLLAGIFGLSLVWGVFELRWTSATIIFQRPITNMRWQRPIKIKVKRD